MSTEREYDRLINDKWRGDDSGIPTDEQAMRGCRALYRKAMGRPWRGKVEIARRRNQFTWINSGVMVVNPKGHSHMHRAGWHDMVHDMSHFCHSRLRPHDRPHSDRQTILEAELTNYALGDAFKRYREAPVSRDPVQLQLGAWDTSDQQHGQQPSL
jgi:hypothetical protein